MCRLQSRASLLLLVAFRVAVCQSASFVMSPLQQASLAEQLYHDLHLPQVQPNMESFWEDVAGQEVPWSLGDLPDDLLDAPFVFPGPEEGHLMRTTLEDIEKEVAKEEGLDDEDVKEPSEEAETAEGVGGRSKREADKGQLEEKREAGLSGPKRAPDFHSWGGKRSNAKGRKTDLRADSPPWSGKRAPDFNSWGGKRAPAFNSWGGKRGPAFNSWGGKRAPAFNSWGGKRAPDFNSWGGKRGPAFNSWGGKRAPAFNSWGGKRAPDFNSWGGKRGPAFNSWGGKRAPDFNSWGGKRAPAFNSWGGKRAPDFNSWGGKRSTHTSNGMFNDQQLSVSTKENTGVSLEDVVQDLANGGSSTWRSLIIKKRSAENELDSPPENRDFQR